MIFRLWSLTLLVTQLVLAYDHKIDLRRCKNETACFIRESCFMDKSDPDEPEFPKWQKTLVQYMGDGLVGGSCDVVLQLKQLSYSKLHVMMQVKLGSADRISIHDGVKVVQGKELFICKPGIITGDQSHYKLNFLGKQTFEDQNVFCSFTVDVFHSTDDYEVLFNSYSGQTKLIYTKNSNQYVEIEHNTEFHSMWSILEKIIRLSSRHCKHTRMSTSTMLNPLNASLLLKEVDTTLTTPRCNTYFAITNPSETDFLYTSKVTCGNLGWSYYDGGLLKEIRKFTHKDFKLFCVDKVCRQCTSVPLSLECDGCEAARLSLAPSDDHYACHTLSCPNDRWTLSGDLIVTGKAECKPSTADPTKFAWFLKETQLEKATCVGMNTTIPVEAK